MGIQSNQERWSKRLTIEYELGRVQEAILPVNAATDTGWFQRLWAYPRCFVRGRIRFWRPEGKATRPTHGSVFVYYGRQEARFRQVSARFAVIVREWET